MEDNKRKIKIGVFGHYGNRNLGDESIICAVIDNIRARVPEAEIVGFSLKPLDTAARYNIPAYSLIRMDEGETYASPGGELAIDMPSFEDEVEIPPQSAMRRLKRVVKQTPVIGPLSVFAQRVIDVAMILPPEFSFLKKSYAVLKGVDLLIISGSNQFLDNFGGAWLFPYNLLKWTVMARLTGTRVAFASVGAGPLNGRLSKLFLKRAVSMADYVSLRDEQSKKIIAETGYRGNSRVCPDLAHSLVLDATAGTCNELAGANVGKPRVAINPMPIYDKRYWCVADDKQYQSYLDKLVEFSGTIINEGYPISFFSTQLRDAYVIDDIVKELLARNYIERRDQCSIDIAHTVAQLIKNMSNYDLVIGTRFHSVLLSLFLGKPTVGICYGKKTEELLVDMGQSEYFSYFEEFSVNDLLGRLHALELNAQHQVEKMRAKSIDYRKSLDRQYDAIVGLLRRETVR